jgi:hypothetical protein
MANDRFAVVISGAAIAEAIGRLLLSCGFRLDVRSKTPICLCLVRCNLDKETSDFFLANRAVVFPDCRNTTTLDFTNTYLENNWELYAGKPPLRLGIGHTAQGGSYFAACCKPMEPEVWRQSSLYQSIVENKDRYHFVEVFSPGFSK